MLVEPTQVTTEGSEKPRVGFQPFLVARIEMGGKTCGGIGEVGMDQQSGSQHGIFVDDGSKLVLGQFDAPAYVRRALNVESDLDGLFGRCKTIRRQWLNQPEKLFHEIRVKAGNWARIEQWVSQPEQLAYLRELELWLQPVLRYPPPIANWFWGLGKSIEVLRGQIRLFNQAWAKFLRETDLKPINQAREAYNRWYLLEKECSMGSSFLASRGFEPIAPLTVEELIDEFPPVPESAEIL